MKCELKNETQLNICAYFYEQILYNFDKKLEKKLTLLFSSFYNPFKKCFFMNFVLRLFYLF